MPCRLSSSATVSRLFLEAPPDTDVGDWPDDRIWAAPAERLGSGVQGWHLESGTITEKSVLPMRSYVQTPMRHGADHPPRTRLAAGVLHRERAVGAGADVDVPVLER